MPDTEACKNTLETETDGCVNDARIPETQACAFAKDECEREPAAPDLCEEPKEWGLGNETREDVFALETEPQPVPDEDGGEPESLFRGLSRIDAGFLQHMRRYTGETVTVYTTGGCGMSGVLMACEDCYVRLLIKPVAAPAWPADQCRCCPFRTACLARKNAQQQSTGPGAVADIPVAQITAFVHSALSGDNGS